MSKIYNYHLLNGDKIIGKLYINENQNEFEIQLIDGLDAINEVPIDFYKLYVKGERVFGTDLVKQWIKDRVIPSSRHGIDGILEMMGLDEYSEIGIFLYCNGRYTQDNYMIQKIK